MVVVLVVCLTVSAAPRLAVLRVHSLQHCATGVGLPHSDGGQGLAAPSTCCVRAAADVSVTRDISKKKVADVKEFALPEEMQSKERFRFVYNNASVP